MIVKTDIKNFKETHRILLQTSDFICVSPHPNLRSSISNYNITFPTAGLISSGFTVMPCGCATISIDKSDNGFGAYLHGPVTKPYIFDGQADDAEMMITIEFRPAGLFVLMGINQNELADQVLPLDVVNPVLSKMLAEVAEKSESISELVASLDTLFLANMHVAYRPELMQALHIIRNCAGNITVKQLSDDIFYSERQLNRIFKQIVGTGTKSYSRLIRINNTFRLLKKPHNSLVMVSDLAGFHDLPHFIHDFKQVCGITPQEYRNNMSDFYNNTTKF